MNDRDRAFEDYVEGRDPDAVFTESLARGDLAELVALSIVDKPGYRRLQAVHTTLRGGEEVVAELCLTTIAAKSPAVELLDAVFDFIDDFSAKLPLESAQTKRLAEAISLDGLTDGQAACAFRWLRDQDLKTALGVARAAISEASLLGTELGREELLALGASSNPADRRAVTDVALARATAGDAALAVDALATLEGLTNPDVIEAAAVLRQLFVLGAMLPAEPMRRFVRQLGADQLADFVSASVPDPATSAAFDQQVLPHLFSEHADVITRMVSDECWPPSSRAWLVDEAAWPSINDSLLNEMLAATRTDDPYDIGPQLMSRIASEVVAHATEDRGPKSMPRLGFRALLTELLDGRLLPTDPKMSAPLDSLAAAVRRREYLGAAWRSPDRASRLGSILREDDFDDVLLTKVFELSDDALAALVETLLPTVSEGFADVLCVRSADRQIVLDSFAQTGPGLNALSRRWRSDDCIWSFRALERADASELAFRSHVAEAVRSYEGPLSAVDRIEVSRSLPRDERVQLLHEVVSERSAHGRHGTDLLVRALNQLSLDLENREVDSANLAELTELCENHPTPNVRVAVYSVLGASAPSNQSVMLLLRRRDAETTPTVVPELEGALTRTGSALSELVAQDIGAGRTDALRSLAEVDPSVALPHARSILAERVEDPHLRMLAAQIVGRHGDDEDVNTLRAIEESEPNPTARQMIGHALRRLEIGGIADAHLRLGEMVEVNMDSWGTLDPADVWGAKSDVLIVALGRVAKHQMNRDRESLVDQLGAELAKLVLFHTITVAGAGLTIKPSDRESIEANQLDYGNLLGRQQLQSEWPEIGTLQELYKLRREHVSEKGTWNPNDDLTDDEFELAQGLFRRGIRQCLDRIIEAKQA